MARWRRNATYQTGAFFLLLLLCATCLLAGQSSGPGGDTGVRAYAVGPVAKDTVKSFTGAPNRVDDTGTTVADLPGTLALAAFLLAGAVLTVTAQGRRRWRLTVISSRAPPGGSASA